MTFCDSHMTVNRFFLTSLARISLGNVMAHMSAYVSFCLEVCLSGDQSSIFLGIQQSSLVAVVICVEIFFIFHDARNVANHSLLEQKIKKLMKAAG